MWISSEKKYVEKLLRTKKKTDAIELAEELYIKLRNEMATINACQHYLYEVAQLVSVVRFCLPSLQIKSHHNTRKGDEIRRITFTHAEWQSFYTTLRNKYVNRKNNTLTDDEYFNRELIRH